ncbi:MAG TPA: hypothetical protein VII11_00780 [Bacteroidota bacterium]
MKRFRKHPFLVFQFALLVLALSAISLLVIACEEEDSTGPDPACGTGQVSWDEKAGVCRNRDTGRVIPATCCN